MLADQSSGVSNLATWIGIVSGVFGILAFFGFVMKPPETNKLQWWLRKVCIGLMTATCAGFLVPWYKLPRGTEVLALPASGYVWSWKLTAANLMVLGGLSVMLGQVKGWPDEGSRPKTLAAGCLPPLLSLPLTDHLQQAATLLVGSIIWGFAALALFFLGFVGMNQTGWDGPWRRR